jgi:hypothetical protein
MGQYYYAANVDNFEYLKPHDFGDGAKLLEFGMSGAGMAMALAGLLTYNKELRGPWAGARVVVTGDYADEGRFVPPALSALNLYSFLVAEDPEDPEDPDDAVIAARAEGIPLPVPQLITQNAKDWLNTLAGKTDVRRGWGGAAPTLMPIPALEDNSLVFDQPEDLVLAMDSVPGDLPVDAVSDMYRALRVNGYDSTFAWTTVQSSEFREDPKTGKVVEWTIEVEPRTTSERQTLSLKFPAKRAAIRKWLGLKAKSAKSAKSAA